MNRDEMKKYIDFVNMCTIAWHKLDSRAVIPTKRPEDAGFDIYTIEDDIEMPPFTKRLFSTGLTAAPSQGYWLMAFDRGSTGSKGIHVHCGVVDNGYRGEIFICLSNDNPYTVKFSSKVDKIIIEETQLNKILYYPTSKAIAQLIPVKQPEVRSLEASDDEWERYYAHNSERGEQKLGASGK